MEENKDSSSGRSVSRRNAHFSNGVCHAVAKTLTKLIRYEWEDAPSAAKAVSLLSDCLMLVDFSLMLLLRVQMQLRKRNDISMANRVSLLVVKRTFVNLLDSISRLVSISVVYF